MVRITDPDWIVSDTVVFKDGYYVFTASDGSVFFNSALNDPLTYDPLDFGTAEINPDRTVDIKKNYREAMALFEVESYDDAVKVAKGIFEKFPDHQLSAKLRVMAGEVAFKDAYMEEASAHYLSAARVLPDSSLKDLFDQQ